MQSQSDSFMWSAAEYVRHEKHGMWYGLYVLGTVLLTALVYLTTKDILSSVIVFVAILGLILFASRKPSVQEYAIDGDMLKVGSKTYYLHDFKAFSAFNGTERSDTVRDLRRLDVLRRGRSLRIVAEADGFLYKMVRSLVGAVVAVGEGKLSIEQLRELLPKHGMSLVEAAAPRSVDVGSAARSLIGKADVFYTSTDNNVVSAYEALVKVGMDAKIPLVAADTDSVARGAVAAYGMDYKALGVQTGEIVVRILKGEQPGAIASETSNKLSLHVNPGAAQKQGITLAEDLVKSASKVVQ